MYQMMDADYEVSAIYFIAGILVLNYWFVGTERWSCIPKLTKRIPKGC